MIFARDEKGNLVEASRSEFGETPRGFCPCCGKQLTARVGEVRRPHWAHESGERCDEWWEEESEWRAAWMKKLRECPALDLQNTLEKEGVRHFYDVKDGESRIWVFRRTRLSTEHVTMREQFFGQMLWFVEAKESEWRRFISDRGSFLKKKIALRTYSLSRSCSGFLSRWNDCHMPVVFDFRAASKGEETRLWYVLRTQVGQAFVLEFPRDDFVARVRSNGRLFQDELPVILDRLISLLEKALSQSEQQASQVSKKCRKIRLHTGVEIPVQDLTSHEVSRSGEIESLPNDSIPEVKTSAPTIEVSFEQRVAQYERLGFSHRDAEARARMK